MNEPENRIKKTEETPKVKMVFRVFTFILILILPILIWFVFGAGIPVTMDYLGLSKRYHDDPTQKLRMNEEEIKKWKKKQALKEEKNSVKTLEQQCKELSEDSEHEYSVVYGKIVHITDHPCPSPEKCVSGQAAAIFVMDSIPPFSVKGEQFSAYTKLVAEKEFWEKRDVFKKKISSVLG